MTGRVAITNTNYPAGAFDCKGHFISGCRNKTVFRIFNLYGNNSQVLPVCPDTFPVRYQSNNRNLAACLYLCCYCLFTLCVTFCLQGARKILYLPFQVPVHLHGLFPQALFVQKQLDFFAVTVNCNCLFLSFFSLPVPVRHYMNHGLSPPP